LQQPAAKLPLPIWALMISSHLRPFAFIRGSAFFFKESAPRGRIALPGVAS